MKQNKDNIYGIDIDKAWNILYQRLEKDELLIDESKYKPKERRKTLLTWIAAVAAVFIGIIFSIFYFSRIDDNSLIVKQNMENSGTLVTTLEDGSIVYLAHNASISYPTAFAKNQRKVELNGNALFCVTKDEKRPFVVKANGITIEVVGTIFAVQSSSDNSFELSVKQGKVNVHSNDNQANVSVEAGETVQLTKSGLSKSGIANCQVFNRYTDKMCFKDEKLNHIIHAINTSSNSQNIVIDESLNNRTLTVTFENDSVETMVELICLALNLEKINKQDTIFIRQALK